MARALGLALAALVACAPDQREALTSLSGATFDTLESGSGEPASTSDADETGAPGSTGASTGSPSTTTAGGDEESTGEPLPPLDPPAGGSSGGSGGGGALGTVRMTPSGVEYRAIAPGDDAPRPLMLVYSGVEGGATMTQNMIVFIDAEPYLQEAVIAVIDGAQYFGDAQAGADVLDDVRGLWDIDNDRTWLFSESAGTTAGLQLGLGLRPSYFAAYWANDVNAWAEPELSADQLGFAPWGNAGPGGAFEAAEAIVSGMGSAGYRIEEPAPYDGPGAGQHGSVEQLYAAIGWFGGRSRL